MGSKKEQEIASQDGPKASEIMRKEYVRKAARVVTEYKKKAAANQDATKSSAEAEPAKSAGPVMLFAGAGANTPEAAGPDAAAAAAAAAAAKKRAAAAEKKRLEWCRREYVDAKDCDKWVANELGQGLKKADQERDREDAERDREDELRDAERDREDKERDEEERKRDARAPVPAMLFAGAGANTPENAEWMNDLTAEQRAKLKSDLAYLDKKSKKEQEIASQDGPKASEMMRKEYVRKAAHVVTESKKRAAATESAKSVPDVAPKVSSTKDMPKKADSQPQEAAKRDAKKSSAEAQPAKSVPDVSPKVSKTHAANQDAKNSVDSEAESAKSEADVAPRVAKTQGPPKQTDSQPEDTAKAVGLFGQGRLGDRLPMLCLASFSGILSIGMLAYFGRSALSQSRQRREAALLNDPAPV